MTSGHGCLCLDANLALLLLLHLQQQRAVNVWQHTTKGNRGADKRVEFFVTTDRELQMAWRDTLDLEILGCIACKLEHFSSQVFKYGSQVYRSFGADARLVSGDGSKVTLYATAGELQ